MKGIEVITGPMFSGKSEELIRRLKRTAYTNQTFLAFSPEIDDRYGVGEIKSHNGSGVTAEVIGDSWEIGKRWAAAESNIIAIDEAQFFGAALPPVIMGLADRGARVIVAGLDTDFLRRPFGPMPAILAVAERVQKLTAVCVKCYGDATLTQRVVDGKPVTSGEQIEVGGIGSYEARCRDCFGRE